MKKSIFLFCIALTITACEPMFFQPDSLREKNSKALFEELWKEFDTFYAPFEERQINWDNLYTQYATQINENSNSEQLYTVLTEMLSKFDDGHIQLNVPNKEVFYSNKIYREKTDYQLFKTELVKEKYLNNQFQESKGEGAIYTSFHGLINEDIIYIHFATVASEWSWIGELKSKYPNHKGFIIDLRHNLGGDFTYALDAIAHLNRQKRLVFKSRTKNGANPNDFTSWYDWHVESKAGDYSKPVIVLVDRFTISAGERAVMAFKTLDNVKLIGVTTNGSISTMIPRQLSNGWNYSISTQKVLDSQGNNWEGKGIPPQIFIQNTFQELTQNKDAVLERAIQEIE